MHKSLYLGRDLALDFYDGGNPISIVTFESRSKYIDALKPSPYGNGFGTGIFAARGYNEFIIKRSRNHWYQTDEIFDVINLINEKTLGSKIIGYDSSMGGFSAINFSHLLSNAIFIAISPLYDITDGNEIGDDRWVDEGRLLDFKYNFIKGGACAKSRGYVFYCTSSIDKEHAERIKQKTEATIVACEYGGHPCSFFINETYGLKRLVDNIAQDRFDINEFQSICIEKSKETYYPYLRASYLHEGGGNIDGAIEGIRTAIEKKPLGDGFHRRLGNLLLKRKKLSEAEKAFRDQLAISPKDSLTHIRLSYVHAERGDFASAALEVGEAIRLDSTQPDYHLRLGEWLFKKGDYAEAERAMERAILMAPNNAKSRVRISYVYAAMRDFRKAVEAMQEAVKIAPEKQEFYVRLGEWLLKDGDLPGAAAAMEEALRLKPSAKQPPLRLKAIRHLMEQESEERAILALRATKTKVGISKAVHHSNATTEISPFNWLQSAMRSVWVKAAVAGAAGAAMFEGLAELAAFAQ